MRSTRKSTRSLSVSSVQKLVTVHRLSSFRTASMRIAHSPAIRFTASQMTRSPLQLTHWYRHDSLAERKRLLAQTHYCTLANVLLQRIQHSEHLAPFSVRRR